MTSTQATPVQPIERLESAIERAESIQDMPLTLSATLCEVFRLARTGFTDTEAEYWARRIEELLAA